MVTSSLFSPIYEWLFFSGLASEPSEEASKSIENAHQLIYGQRWSGDGTHQHSWISRCCSSQICWSRRDTVSNQWFLLWSHNRLLSDNQLDFQLQWLWQGSSGRLERWKLQVFRYRMSSQYHKSMRLHLQWPFAQKFVQLISVMERTSSCAGPSTVLAACFWASSCHNYRSKTRLLFSSWEQLV